MSQHYRTSILPIDARTSGRGRPDRPPLVHNMSPDRGTLTTPLYAKYDRTYRYRDDKLNYDIFTDHRPQLDKPPFIRKNGFVYEDIYAGSAWNGDFKHKYDYSSPYKTIKPQYLTLGNGLGTKYSTLPKSWSANTASSSYSRNSSFVAPVRSNFTPKYEELMKDFSYVRRRAPRDYRRDYILSLQDRLNNERRFDNTKIYDNNSLSAKYYVNAAVASQVGNNVPSRHRSVDSYQSGKTINGIRQDRWPVRHSEFFDHVVQQDSGKRQTTKLLAYEYNHIRYAENRPLRKAEYEVKKNVTFSEVSGCEERNNTVGGKSGLVRELEVALSQVDDVKVNRVPIFKNGTAVVIPNGHCVGAGKFVEQTYTTGRLPPKVPPQGGFLAGVTKKKYLSQVIASLAVSLAPFAGGLGKGYSSPAIASLQQLNLRKPYNSSAQLEIPVSDQEASWVASLSLLGALFGGVMGGVAMRHGRRKVLLVMSLPFSLSWILTVFATSIEMMFFTSFMGGFCCSIVSMASQVYVSEIAVPDIRGCLNAVLKIVGHLGVLMSFIVGAYLDWQQLAMFISIAPIILFCTMIYIPETPSYLVLCGKEDEAYKSLVWLRDPGSDIGQELATIRANVHATKSFNNQNLQTAGSTAFNALLTARIGGPVLITCGLMLFQRLSGAQAFNFYAVPIFKKTFGGMNPHGGAIAVSFVQLLASCLSGLLIDTVGRLPLLIASSVFMSMALASFGSYVYYEEVHKNHQKLQSILLNQAMGPAGQNDWIPLLCVLVFTIAFSLGMSPISWLLIGELFPLEFRGSGSALATAFSYLCAFIGVKTYVDFQQMLGLHGAFWLYAMISVGGLCFVVLFVPETKGRDLDEMNPKAVQNFTIQR